MELHPYLDHDTRPSGGWWYVMTLAGECPSRRVGHTSVYVSGHSEGDAGKVYFIGGANPSGPFCETYVLDLNTRTWDTVDSAGLRPRYEHAAFVPKSLPGRIYVFGGANQAGNLNDVQVLDTSTNTWATVSASGMIPAPRTHHTTASVGDSLIVYSGGHMGADPVGDRQVHCFDALSGAWSVLALRGDSPKPRHGHAMAAVGGKVFVHGGMAGSTFYDDLHVLDLEKKAWVSVKKKRTFPSARAAHGMVACGTDVFLFGGMNKDGALDDLHRLDTTTMTWSRVELQGPPPASRLDFATCAVELRVPMLSDQLQAMGNLSSISGHAKEVLQRELRSGSASSRDSRIDASASEAELAQETTDEEVEQVQAKGENHSEVESGAASGNSSVDTVRMLLLHGGMDTEGELFDDTLVFLI